MWSFYFCISIESFTHRDILLSASSGLNELMTSEESRRWSHWLNRKCDETQFDFGLSQIAKCLGQEEALNCYWRGAELESSGDVDGAIICYKRAFKKWPALDSIPDGGVPRAVREQAEACGVSSHLLTIVSVNSARLSKVACSTGLLSASDLSDIEGVKTEITAKESPQVNNPQNATHVSKVGIFLNNPPDFSMVAIAPGVVSKMLSFAAQAWEDHNWSGSSADPGPLYGVPEDFSTLSIRVIEHWEYSVGGGLTDALHYDNDSILTIVALLSGDFEGGVFRTYEEGGVHLEHHMAPGDAICFLSHKYHNITPLSRGSRRSMVIELWEGGTGHTGR